MSISALPQLDGIGSLAAGAKTHVYVDNLFPPQLRGLSDYSQRGHFYVVTLNPALRDDLEEVFYHECAHCRLGHINTTASNPVRVASYHKLVQKAHALADGESYYLTVGQVRREQEASAEAIRLRNEWPFVAYRLWRLITEKETYP
jgi:hypothetical protein